MDALTREGVLINVSIRYWRATKKLRAEDLGLDPEQITDRLISLGHKNLLPREKLQEFALIESRAHALVEGNTFPFLNGLAHFLPNTRLAEVTGNLKALEVEFDSAKAGFLERYADLRHQAVTEWSEVASRLVPDPERLVATIKASFPNPADMERAFGFETQLYQVRAPERLDMALVSAAQQQEVIRAREEAAQAAATRIQEGAQQFVADCVASLRQQTAQLCQEMLESMRSGKTGVHQKTLNRLVRFIDQFKQLNFVGDQEMETQLDRVRQEFLNRTAEEYRDNEHARTQLRQGLEGLAAVARDLAQQDSRELVERFGQLGLRKFNLAA